MSLVPHVIDAVALLVAMPTAMADLYAVLFLPKGAPASNHILARAFRRLDAWADYHMATASYVALDYLVLRLVWITWTAPLGPLWKAGIIASLLGSLVALVYPLMAVYNLAGWAVWRNLPIHLDKQSYFPNSARLEDPETFRAIRRELEAVLREDEATQAITDIYANVTVLEADGGRAEAVVERDAVPSGWRSVFLRMADRDIARNQARMPTVAALLRDMPEVYNAFFSILDPRHRIVPHRGYFKGILRYHLGVVVPEPKGAWLVCGGERYHWAEGSGVLFDDMYVHSVENHLMSPRIVLFMDIRRPLGGVARAITESLGWIVGNHPYHRALRAAIEAPNS